MSITTGPWRDQAHDLMAQANAKRNQALTTTDPAERERLEESAAFDAVSARGLLRRADKTDTDQQDQRRQPRRSDPLLSWIGRRTLDQSERRAPFTDRRRENLGRAARSVSPEPDPKDAVGRAITAQGVTLGGAA